MTAQDTLPERYGRAPRAPRPPRRSRRAAVLAGCGILALIAVVAALAFWPDDHPVDPQDAGYDVRDAALTVVSLAVVPDERRTVRCGVRAINEYEAVVGYREVAVGPRAGASTTDPVHLRVEVSTTQRAATGNVDHCWFED
ncbi:DUF4307 domain-containing protein [Brevibacterium sp. BRM-1]|uniref:DUF4307 domain-containing protein n=1 Tax=Brevibacterium sp. BRM-1 TaxID=2999062 RepID=UPI0022820A4A|nr:DUF4307 domain-containing protein [Brevibacterium sp. BRM-1]WAL40363.1 DUF4307 domain-containing protein [Brevibacterium sp. BRM-1]